MTWNDLAGLAAATILTGVLVFRPQWLWAGRKPKQAKKKKAAAPATADPYQKWVAEGKAKGYI